MTKTDVIKLSVTAMADEGLALGRYEGQVVFVPGAIPGEVIQARLVSTHKRWAHAEVIDILDPSPQRIVPSCPYFGLCGGCHWQHIEYQAQLMYKCQVVTEQLQRLGHIQDPPVKPMIGMAEPWAYRNHVQFSLTDTGQIGFQAYQSHQVVPVDECLLVHSLLDEMHVALDLDWPELRRLSLRAGIRTGQRMCIFETQGDVAPELEVDFPLSCVLRHSDGTDIVLIGQDCYHEMLRNKTFRVSAGSFFQANTEQTEAMLDIVERYLEPEPEDTLLDVYCGVGTFCLSVQSRVGRIIGVEESPAAIADANLNAGEVEQVSFLPGKAAEILPSLDVLVDKVILDPPRKGCEAHVLAEIARLNPSRIVYVSCDPASLSRDAVHLIGQGYKLVEVQPVDMFPQTYHVETVSLWRKGAR